MYPADSVTTELGVLYELADTERHSRVDADGCRLVPREQQMTPTWLAFQMCMGDTWLDPDASPLFRPLKSGHGIPEMRAFTVTLDGLDGMALKHARMLVEAAGAGHSSALTRHSRKHSRTTHLVVNGQLSREERLARPMVKAAVHWNAEQSTAMLAVEPGSGERDEPIYIVTDEWLFACVLAWKRVPEASFALSSATREDSAAHAADGLAEKKSRGHVTGAAAAGVGRDAAASAQAGRRRAHVTEAAAGADGLAAPNQMAVAKALVEESASGKRKREEREQKAQDEQALRAEAVDIVAREFDAASACEGDHGVEPTDRRLAQLISGICADAARRDALNELSRKAIRAALEEELAVSLERIKDEGALKTAAKHFVRRFHEVHDRLVDEASAAKAAAKAAARPTKATKVQAQASAAKPAKPARGSAGPSARQPDSSDEEAEMLRQGKSAAHSSTANAGATAGRGGGAPSKRWTAPPIDSSDEENASEGYGNGAPGPRDAAGRGASTGPSAIGARQWKTDHIWVGRRVREFVHGQIVDGVISAWRPPGDGKWDIEEWRVERQTSVEHLAAKALDSTSELSLEATVQAMAASERLLVEPLTSAPINDSDADGAGWLDGSWITYIAEEDETPKMAAARMRYAVCAVGPAPAPVAAARALCLHSGHAHSGLL